ncbi:hypothetical protein [Haloprofundus salinisoli]|uniref:hypothetical protein n=1 Tax=Haloprofundus salinisoli TaxID=2876193 RepID=UPI001CCDDBC6|nr:hypothetical protein [Haloprofundus salinisoli]
MSDVDRLRRRVRALEDHVLGAEAEEFAGAPPERTERPLDGLIRRVRRLEREVLENDDRPELRRRVDELERRVEALERSSDARPDGEPERS